MANSNTTTSAFCLLVAAHDHVWRSGNELKIRKASCEMIWRLAILTCREPAQYIAISAEEGRSE